MTDQDRRILVAQLWATRASIDAALTAFGELGNDLTSDVDDSCTHPPENRENLTTLGGPEEWRCRRCGFSTRTHTTDPKPE